MNKLDITVSMCNHFCNAKSRVLYSMIKNSHGVHLCSQVQPYKYKVVTVCGVGGRTLFVGFHPFRFGWMNLRNWRDASKWGASFLALHSCQVKPCEWVCGKSLCEVTIACFCNKSCVFLLLLILLDSLMVEWEITWFIMCIWREN